MGSIRSAVRLYVRETALVTALAPSLFRKGNTIKPPIIFCKFGAEHDRQFGYGYRHRYL